MNTRNLRKTIEVNISHSPVCFNVTLCNCYAYALGITDTWLQLGAAADFGENWDTVTPTQVLQAFEADMNTLSITILQKLGRGDVPQLSDTQLLVGVYWAHDDYHFIRFDKDGKWSHKPGKHAVKKLDVFPPYQLGRYEYICSYLLEV